MKHTTLAFAVAALAGAALAQDSGGPPRPPQEAFTACSGLSQGAACSVTFRGETRKGTCDAPPGITQLACRPEGMGPPPGGRGHTPPQAAITACSGLKADAACGFTLDGNNLTGTCAAPPDGSGTLACRPAGGPPGHRGPPQEAVAACSGLSANASCSFTFRQQTVSGTCATPPDGSGSLACRPANMGPPPGQ